MRPDFSQFDILVCFLGESLILCAWADSSASWPPSPSTP